MPKFTDRHGREWEFIITGLTLPRLREVGFDPPRAVRDMTYLAAALDPEMVIKALWVLCEKSAKGREVGPESFADGFDGPAFAAATDALLGATVDMSLPPDVAGRMRERLAEEGRRAEAEAIARLSRPAPADLTEPVSNPDFVGHAARLSRPAADAPEG